MDQHPTGPRTALPPARSPNPAIAATAGAVLVTGAFLFRTGWDLPISAIATIDPVQHRIFLTVWGLGVALLAFGLLRRAIPTVPSISRGWHAAYIGVLIGAALGSLPWSSTGSVFLYQVWWTVPLIAGLLELQGSGFIAARASRLRSPPPER
ncbi:hypothetical protein CDO52_11570 [Nocardiopsis gilva YIM 90087]|uniref:Uncharacterized protein n=1 Tax=Nocardiopsis gilva YIM 90087 TaxID=1235441 RepID=A0A223S5C1_9ACTN|nr:hypothetical protein [Nocardiopsis gilva]ASU83332.1 hypothetical protein CDO52_11570 [Nocardiopsis gilva YIM 90087]